MPTANQPVRPRLACEVMVDRVVAARMDESGSVIDLVTSRTLADGVLTPSLKETNVQNPAALSAVITDALSAMGGRVRDVSVVLPDAAVRTVLLDFDEFPDREEDAQSVLHLRLRKSLPFDVDRARISFHVDRRTLPVRVVAAVALTSVIEEYELAFSSAGYACGVVLPSTLAALGLVADEDATLMVKIDPGVVTVAISQAGELRLLRTVENAAGRSIAAQQLADEVYPSVMFYQDNFASPIRKVLVGGLDSLQELGPALEQLTGAPPEALVGARHFTSSASMSNASQLAGVVGALI